MQLYAKFPNTCVNIVEFSGLLTVTEEIYGELVLSSEFSRCSLDMKKCEQYSKRNFRDFCNKYMTNNILFSPAFGNVEPQITCPVKPGNYTVKHTVFDLTLFSMLSLDGFVYIGKIEMVVGVTKRKPALCFQIETKVIKSRKATGCS